MRNAVVLASVLGREIHIDRIRARRPSPGLRPQHLSCVNACACLCNAQVEGATVNSTHVAYRPGSSLRGGRFEFDIGTAGSTTLVIASVLPLALFADGETRMKVSGGLFQDFAPSAHHMQHVLLPILSRMGVTASLRVVRPGYYPRGGGTLEVVIHPLGNCLRPLKLLDQGAVTHISSVALASHLRKQQVSQRMADGCREVLANSGYQAAFDIQYDDSAFQAGASLGVWAETDSGCLLGSDRAGKKGRRSEQIGESAARSLLDDLATGATVDRYLADQLVVYGALARGVTEYAVPCVTEHLEANLWLVRQFGVHAALDGNAVRIEGRGHLASHSTRAR